MATREETAVAVKKIVADIRALDVVTLLSTDLEVIVAAARLRGNVKNFETITLPTIDVPSSPPPPEPP